METVPNEKPQRIKFSPMEDQRLTSLVQYYGIKSWNIIASQLSGRTPRQCRDRWNHYLCPQTNTTQWTPEEDALLKQLIHKYGKQWTKIALHFPGRQAISIRNRCCKLSRQLNADPYLREILQSENSKNIHQNDDQNQPVITPHIPDSTSTKFPSCASLLEMTPFKTEPKFNHFYASFPEWIESIKSFQTFHQIVI